MKTKIALATAGPVGGKDGSPTPLGVSLDITISTSASGISVHFRLLMAPHGGMLRRLLHHNSHESNISRAIKQIRKTFKNPLVIPELAMEVGMSPSSFHKYFKFITKTTPLQYQKDLRLLEAKRSLNLKSHSVSRTTYKVGYESATQFSREYARKFSVPPWQDLGTV